MTQKTLVATEKAPVASLAGYASIHGGIVKLLDAAWRRCVASMR